MTLPPAPPHIDNSPLNLTTPLHAVQGIKDTYTTMVFDAFTPRGV
jgi:hypothetical protein